MHEISEVWIFVGTGSRFPSGVFLGKSKAEMWILENQLSGILTKYPLDTGVYDWAIKNNVFTPKEARDKSPEFIQSFSSASQEHYHYENGVR